MKNVMTNYNCFWFLGTSRLWAIWWVWCCSCVWQCCWPDKHKVYLQSDNRNPVLWLSEWGHECGHLSGGRVGCHVLGHIQVMVIHIIRYIGIMNELWFSSGVGFSETTGYDWTQTSEVTKNEQVTVTVEAEAPPGGFLAFRGLNVPWY